MKHLRLALLLSGAIMLSSCGDNASDKVKKENVENIKANADKKGFPTMTFESTEHNFGDINEGDIVETVFKFKNEGKVALIIMNARASCGCTVPKYTDKPILPGEEGEISVKFNSNRKPGKQKKRVTLTTNTEEGRELVYISANVAKKISNKQ
ncbi:MAG: DUF1573 domain-containing protein [Flavobacteriales bacterium]|nr:DUF1573 domain-containing protein [Flavobacteriales bacterium]